MTERPGLLDAGGGMEPSHLMLILGMVLLVWVLTVVILGFAARCHHATRHIHCPLLRRDVDVQSDEWDDRLLDVRACSGLLPSTDFELCGKGCLDVDEIVVSPRMAAHSPRG